MRPTANAGTIAPACSSRATKQDSGLDRSIGLWQLVFYGSGTILGAGIFVVVGEVLGVAGALTPFAYALAAVVAMTSALSFAEMGARIPTAGGPIDYLERAFHMRWLGSGAGWVLMVANTVSAATIVTGFAAYLDSFASVPGWIATFALIIVLGGIAVAGIKESSWLMAVTTIIGIAALLAVLWALRDALMAFPGALLSGPAGDTGREAGPVAFSFGFDGFGMLIAMALVGTGEFDIIAGASAQLVKAVELSGWPGLPIAIASLFVIVNGALTQIIAASCVDAIAYASVFPSVWDRRGEIENPLAISCQSDDFVTESSGCGPAS